MALKTLTFMVGSRDKEWSSPPSIELRDVEQWFVDGRDRMVRRDSENIDISEVGRVMTSEQYHYIPRFRLPVHRRTPWHQLRVVNVRVVAWKRGR